MHSSKLYWLTQHSVTDGHLQLTKSLTPKGNPDFWKNFYKKKTFTADKIYINKQHVSSYFGIKRDLYLQ